MMLLAMSMLARLRRHDSREVAPHAAKALVEILVVVRDEQVSGVLAQCVDIRPERAQTLGGYRVDHVPVLGPIPIAEVGERGDSGLVDGIRLFEDDGYVCG